MLWIFFFIIGRKRSPQGSLWLLQEYNNTLTGCGPGSDGWLRWVSSSSILQQAESIERKRVSSGSNRAPHTRRQPKYPVFSRYNKWLCVPCTHKCAASLRVFHYVYGRYVQAHLWGWSISIWNRHSCIDDTNGIRKEWLIQRNRYSVGRYNVKIIFKRINFAD